MNLKARRRVAEWGARPVSVQANDVHGPDVETIESRTVFIPALARSHDMHRVYFESEAMLGHLVSL